MVRELVKVYRVNLFQKDKVRLTHALVTASALHRTTYVHRQTFCVGVLFIPPNNGIHLVHSKTEFIDSTKEQYMMLVKVGITVTYLKLCM